MSLRNTKTSHHEPTTLGGHTMSIRALAVVASLTLLFLLAGCSGGTPVATDFDGNVANAQSTFGEGVFMRAKLVVDPGTMTAEILPRNNAAVGDLYADLEITSFLIYPFCPDATCLYVKGLGIISGTPPDISVTIGVAHPFAKYAGDPPTANNRADLDLFDLRVYLVNNGGVAPNPEVDTITGLATGDIVFTPGLVVGADGYDDGADAIAVDAADGLDGIEVTEVTSYNYVGTNFQPYMRAFEGTGDPFAFVPGEVPIAEDNRYCHGEEDEVTFVLSLEPGAEAVEFDIAVAGGFGAAAQGKLNRTPANVKYFKAYRTTRPFIGLQDPPVTDGDSGVPSVPALNIWITHPWAGLAAAADKAAYQAQANNGELLPPGAIGPGVANLTFALRLVDTADPPVNGPYDFIALPTETGTGTDADPWLFSVNLEDPVDTPIPDGTYNAYIYVLADVGDFSADHPLAVGDNYSFYYAEDLLVQTI